MWFFIFMLVFAPVAGDQSEELTAVEYNRDLLVMLAAQGRIAPPRFYDTPYKIDPDGGLHVIPGTGSITYNFRSGDSAYHIAGDHVEPAVTLYNPGDTNSRDSRESRGFNTLSCIGNRVLVLTGEAKGAEGRVIGKHGGSEHVMVDFADDDVFHKLAIGDRMRVYTYGLGMEFTNFEGVKIFNMSPYLLEALTEAGMGITDDGKLRVPVARLIPSKIMGSGLGSNQVYRGDYDIQLFDEGIVKKYELDKLRFGDIVAIIDAQHDFGRIYLKGAICIGVIAHSRSFMSGHGPGVTTLLSSAKGKIEPVLDENANLAKLLKIR